VLLKIMYLLTCRVLTLAVLVFRGDLAKDAELLAVRHENAVLRRHAGRVRCEPADRAWFAMLARLVPRRRWAEVFPMTPATLLAWHRRLAAKKYDTSKWRKPGARRQALESPALSHTSGAPALLLSQTRSGPAPPGYDCGTRTRRVRVALRWRGSRARTDTTHCPISRYQLQR
jgi:hypothetical protein